MHICFVVFV